ncbi:hypothetical protein T4A_7456 [Trichinella pseudospiralis]|uniref:Uncharacterized protein n=1 Tax=Trichinella pseudospiralis TaxID=6337 RepID=A0A0V1DU32_TRIPS|nr:hypothetical protein T4A_7456 [Trichinella pseudospiralis]
MMNFFIIHFKVSSMPSSISSRSVGRYRRSRSRTGSRTRRQRRPRSRSRSLRRSPRQSLSPSSRLGLQRKTSAVALDGDDISAEIICPSCLQSLQSRSRSRSITKRKSLGKKVAGKAAAKSTSKSGRKPSRSKKKSVKKSNRKAVSIRSTKSRRKRSSLKLTTRKKRIDVEVETLDRQAMVLSCHEKISITLSDQLEYLNVDYIDCSLSKSILHVLF